MPYALEFAYYLTGGPILAVLAGFGLWQLVLAKRSLDTSRIAIETARDDMDQRIRSEKMRLAVDLCIRFSEHVLPLIEEAGLALKDHPFPEPKAGGDKWIFESYELTWNAGSATVPTIQKVVRALNAMEAVAIPFKWGCADCVVAKDSIGPAFVQAADDFAYLVAFLRREQTPEAYPALRAIFQTRCVEQAHQPDALRRRRASRDKV